MELKFFPDVMVDIECTGLKPDAAILSIGAVSFDMRALELGEMFYITINLENVVAYGGKIEAGTFLWWLKQSEQAREAAQRNACPDLMLALGQFSDFMHKCAPENGVKIWGNGPDFDCVKIEHHYRMTGQALPWKFWNQRCFRTVRGLYPNVEDDPRDGTHHNALDDAIWQAKHLLKIRRTLRGNA